MRVQQAIETFLARLRPESTDSVDELSWDEFREQAGESREEYIVLLLEANGGSLTQTKLTEKSGVAKSTMSRWLTDLEANGVIDRKQIGREKVVYLSTDMPPSM